MTIIGPGTGYISRSLRWRLSGPEKFVNLRGFLAQSSKLFDISSVQCSSLGTSLSGKFVQFSSGHRTKCFSSARSVQFIQFSSRTLPALVSIHEYAKYTFDQHYSCSLCAEMIGVRIVSVGERALTRTLRNWLLFGENVPPLKCN